MAPLSTATKKCFTAYLYIMSCTGNTAQDQVLAIFDAVEKLIVCILYEII